MSLTRATMLDLLGLDSTSDRLGIALSVVVVAALGALTYVLAAWLLRCREVGQAWSLLRRALKRGNSAAKVGS
jgi:phosphatidylglycerophosphate synthase